MSHVATVQCQIVDLDAFEEAVSRKGGQLMRGQKNFKSYQPNRVCEHAVRLRDNRDAYEIGLTPRTDGAQGFNLAYDSWGPGAALDRAFGPALVGLQNEYMAAAAEKKARAYGYSVQRVDEGQEIRLYVRP